MYQQQHKTMEETFKDLLFDLNLYGIDIKGAHSLIIDRYGCCQVNFHSNKLNSYLYQTLNKMNFTSIEFTSSTMFFNKEKNLTIGFYNN